jgi:hypothetical protein
MVQIAHHSRSFSALQSLNVMQACHMAYDETNENTVYACTGNPLPSDLRLMLNTLNNDPMQKAMEGQSSVEGRMQSAECSSLC